MENKGQAKSELDDKDKKIASLRDLLGQAKLKIQQLKNQLSSKEKEIIELKNNYDKKIKTLENQSAQIMKQYQERLIRYQKSFEDSQALVTKYQNQNQIHNNNFQTILASITQINNLTTKVFTLGIPKQNSDAVQELCNIQKCKEYINEIQKLAKEEVEPIIKTIKKLIELYTNTLSKKRDARLGAIKKEGLIKKHQQDHSNQIAKLTQKINFMEKERQTKDSQYQQRIEQLTKNKLKNADEKINQQFIKELFLKIMNGPTVASIMAFQVLAKVLKLSEEEYNKSIKNIK